VDDIYKVQQNYKKKREKTIRGQAAYRRLKWRRESKKNHKKKKKKKSLKTINKMTYEQGKLGRMVARKRRKDLKTR